MWLCKRTLVALGLLALSSSVCSAALVLQSEYPSYTLSPDGSTTALVRIYLAQTDPTTILSDEGGLNSVGFQVTAVDPPTVPPTLSSIAGNTGAGGFSTVIKSEAQGTLYAEMSDLVSGVPANGAGRVLLGTFTFSGGPGVAATTFQIADKRGDDTYTAVGSLLDPQIQPGTFTITIPEPAAITLLGAAGLLLLVRRRLAR